MFVSDFIDVDGPWTQTTAWLHQHHDQVTDVAAQTWALYQADLPSIDNWTGPLASTLMDPVAASATTRFTMDWSLQDSREPITILRGDLVIQPLRVDRTHLEAQCTFYRGGSLTTDDENQTRRVILRCIRTFLTTLATDIDNKPVARHWTPDRRL